MNNWIFKYFRGAYTCTKYICIYISKICLSPSIDVIITIIHSKELLKLFEYFLELLNLESMFHNFNIRLNVIELKAHLHQYSIIFYKIIFYILHSNLQTNWNVLNRNYY